MKKKRIISFLIAMLLMMQLGAFRVVFADENAEKSMTVLQKIGILSTEDIENAGQTVNRAKFTYYAARALDVSIDILYSIYKVFALHNEQTY